MTPAQHPVKPAFAWCGGKQRLVRKILPHLPDTGAYCEPFAGALSVLLYKQPSRVETVNDYDGYIVNFYRVLQDFRKRAQLLGRLHYTPYSKDEFAKALRMLERADASEVDRAWAFFVRICQGFGGQGNGKHWGVNKASTGGTQACGFFSAKNAIDAVAARLLNVQIENRHWAQVFTAYDVPNGLTYLDPPYYGAAQPYNAPHFGDELWTELRDLCLQAKGAVALSTTPNKYAQELLDAGWHKVEFEQLQSIDRNTSNRKKRLEWLCLNPRCVELAGKGGGA